MIQLTLAPPLRRPHEFVGDIESNEVFALTSSWPYPGDQPLQRARRVARAYREHLHRVDPDLCATLDEQICERGETWIAPRILRYDLDDWLSPAEAADIAAVSVAALRTWRARGRLTGRHTTKGWRYRARDVLVLASEVRRRTGEPATRAEGPPVDECGP